MAKSNKHIPGFISLATKNAVVYFLLIIIGFGILGFLLLKNSAQEIIQSAEQQLVHASESVELKFESNIQDIKRDIKHLGKSPYLRDYLTDPTSLKKELLAGEYLALLNSKPDYAQIRLIGIDDSGLEIIRAERSQNSTFLVPENKLQQKGDRNYFIETIALPPDSIYFSIIDLNKEHGEISQPIMPTLRVSYPIYTDGDLFGLIVINADLRNLFEALKVLAGTQFNLKIVNQDGHFITHPDDEKSFTFEYKNEPQFFNDFGFEIGKIINQLPKVIHSEKDLFVFRSLPYPRTNYFLYVGVGAKKDQLLASFYQWRNTSLSIVFGLAILFLFIAFLYMKRQAKELKEITTMMTSFPKTIEPTKLPIQRNDEIGHLAKSFEEMSKTISENLTSLKLSKDEAEKAYREKEEFLENMSHEIRNPLHSILGMTYLLEKNQPAKHQAVFIDSLKSSTNNLLSLVNDILDYKKLSEGKLSIKKTWFLLPDFIEQIISSHRFHATSKKLEITFKHPPKLNHLEVYFDKTRLTQIINNLIVNAIKFTNEGGWVKVNLEIKNENKNELKIRFSVQDNGIGIAPEKIKEIKSRYYTKHEDQPVDFLNSSGLGLSIIIQLLELFGSKLEIQSEEGIGSDFYFDLHLNSKNADPQDLNQNAQITASALKNIRLLVIDDDPQIIEIYNHIFTPHVQSLQTIISCDQLTTLENEQFDVIISDVLLDNDNISTYSKKIKKLLTPDGLFYLSSGYELTTKFLEIFDFVKEVFQKPVEAKVLFHQICFDVSVLKYGIPNTSSILADYDYDSFKFKKAINLLLEEWRIMNTQLETSILEREDKKYAAIGHKLITSVRRLKLYHFENQLSTGLKEIKNEHSDVIALAAEIKGMMDFYIWYIQHFSKSDQASN